MIGRQLPLMAVILPFYVMALYGGWRSIRALWPVLAVAGLSFGLAQFGVVQLPGLHADRCISRRSARWSRRCCSCRSGARRRTRSSPSRRALRGCRGRAAARNVPAWQGWMPWLVVTAVVILWTYLQGRAHVRSMRFPGRAWTRRCRSRSTTTSLMQRFGRFSRSAPEPPSWSPR